MYIVDELVNDKGKCRELFLYMDEIYDFKNNRVKKNKIQDHHIIVINHYYVGLSAMKVIQKRKNWQRIKKVVIEFIKATNNQLCLIICDCHEYSFIGGIRAVAEFCGKYDINYLLTFYNGNREIALLENHMNVLASNTFIIRMNNMIRKGVFKDYKLNKTFDIFFFGAVSDYYPLRKRLMGLFNTKAFRNNFKIVFAKYDKYKGYELSKMLNKSYLCVATMSQFEYLVKKYFEISASKSLILGNMPKQGEDILRKSHENFNVVHKNHTICVFHELFYNKLMECINIPINIISTKESIENDTKKIIINTIEDEENITKLIDNNSKELINDGAIISKSNTNDIKKSINDTKKSINDVILSHEYIKDEHNIELTVSIVLSNGNNCIDSDGAIWLALESLRRQKYVSFDWELLVLMDKNDAKVKHIVTKYRDLLPNCKRINLYVVEKQTDILDKIIYASNLSSVSSKIFVIQEANFYSSPKRLYIHYEHFKNDNCYVSTQPLGLFYNLHTKDIIFYDGYKIDYNNKLFFLSNHLNMAVRTSDIKQIKNNIANKKVGRYIKKSIMTLNKINILDKYVYTDDEIDPNNWKYSLSTYESNNKVYKLINYKTPAYIKYNKDNKKKYNYQGLERYIPVSVLNFITKYQ